VFIGCACVAVACGNSNSRRAAAGAPEAGAPNDAAAGAGASSGSNDAAAGGGASSGSNDAVAGAGASSGSSGGGSAGTGRTAGGDGPGGAADTGDACATDNGGAADYVQPQLDAGHALCQQIITCYPDFQIPPASACWVPQSDSDTGGQRVFKYTDPTLEHDAETIAGIKACLFSLPNQAALRALYACVTEALNAEGDCYSACPLTGDQCESARASAFSACSAAVSECLPDTADCFPPPP